MTSPPSGTRSVTAFTLLVFAIVANAANDATAIFERAQSLLFARRAAEASPLFEKAVAMRPNLAAYHLWLARSYAAEAKTSSNVLRLFEIGWKSGTELETAVRLDPDSLDARLDLLRYYVLAPRVVGGSNAKARAEAAEIGKRDAALGAFVDGYLAYRRKDYGLGRNRLRDAVKLAKTSETKVLALTWLGYLSQETQRYDDAFAAFDEILRIDPSHAAARYEIGRAALFSGREIERGTRDVEAYLKTTPKYDEPSLDEARELLAKLTSPSANRRRAPSPHQ